MTNKKLAKVVATSLLVGLLAMPTTAVYSPNKAVKKGECLGVVKANAKPLQLQTLRYNIKSKKYEFTDPTFLFEREKQGNGVQIHTSQNNSI